MSYDKRDYAAINAIRALSVDAINQANSGHPGLPMGAAPMMYVLWSRFLKTDPSNPEWTDRDRFVLSAGHGSAMLYSLLHLSGFDVSMEDMRNFRQLDSKTPGHPEYGWTQGVEATTGPLGQGLANAVGMAMAERHLAAKYNRDDATIVDHYTYALVGDGCLMEGITSEASSLAGHLKLGKLIVLYDSNDICLDGPISMSFTEDVAKRYEAYGWQVLRVEDGEDPEAIEKAITMAKEETQKPTLIEVKTVIGYGCSLQGTSKVHGAPIGPEDTEKARKAWGWDYEPFEIPQDVYEKYSETLAERGKTGYTAWQKEADMLKTNAPEIWKEYIDGFSRKLPENLYEKMSKYEVEDKAEATRATSEHAIQEIANLVPQLWGGSADLSSSNKTMIKNSGNFMPDHWDERNIWYGVREFAMGAIMNGILLHGGTWTYGGTFFVFSDYLRHAIRLAALSKLPAVYVFTHDSIAVGEDGPTHEPVEHLASFRAMPEVDVLRPADGNEVNAAWVSALEGDKPVLLVLTRQNLPVLQNTATRAEEGVKRGAYILKKENEHIDGILIATGSEVSLAMDAAAILEEKGLDIRVVSMPSMERFEAQSSEYKEEVIPSEIKNRMSIEMAVTFGWDRYVGDQGLTYGIDRFGASGKANEVMEKFGFTPEKVAQAFLERFQ